MFHLQGASKLSVFRQEIMLILQKGVIMLSNKELVGHPVFKNVAHKSKTIFSAIIYHRVVWPTNNRKLVWIVERVSENIFAA